jgi:hypothetical protein
LGYTVKKKGKFMIHPRIYLALALLLLVGLACAMPALPMDDDTFNTAVAQTVAVGLTQKYVSPTFTASPTLTLTPTITFTPEPPTATSLPADTVSPTFPYMGPSTATPMVLMPLLIVTVNTNCRTGPDKSFRVEGSLLKGETTTVHGIDTAGQYWYIRNPDPGLEFCWLSGKYATVSGDLALLPVMTAMPTPTVSPTSTPIPEFKMNYSKLEACNTWWVDMELVNKGGLAFQSALIKIKEPLKGRTLSLSSNGFINADGCNTSTIVEDVLAPGKSVIVSSPELGYDPSGKKLIVTISVCTEPDGDGLCLTETMTFKP